MIIFIQVSPPMTIVTEKITDKKTTIFEEEKDRYIYLKKKEEI